MDVLAQGERSVDELAAEIHQSLANTSQRLQRLLRAGLACSRRSGTRIYYSLASPAMERLWRALRETPEAHTGELGDLVRAYIGDRDGLSMITRLAAWWRGRRSPALSRPIPARSCRSGTVARPFGAQTLCRHACTGGNS
jgi:hypothetical protein